MTDACILLTGGSNRVGRAIALELARRGLDLVLTYDKSRDDCQQTASLCRDVPHGLIYVDVIQLSLESTDTIRSTVVLLVASGIDGVVHNASRYTKTPIDGLDVEEVLLQFRINALAPLFLTSLLAPALRDSRLPNGGSVVCLGDIHAMGRPRRDYAGYLASKGALERIIESMAIELAPDVRVNGVAPGVVAWAEGEFSESLKAEYVQRIPQDRSGTLEEAAGTVCWLLLEASYVDGSIIRLDGGRFLR